MPETPPPSPYDAGHMIRNNDRRFRNMQERRIFVKKNKKFPNKTGYSRNFQNFSCEIAKKYLQFFVKYAKIDMDAEKTVMLHVPRVHAFFRRILLYGHKNRRLPE